MKNTGSYQSASAPIVDPDYPVDIHLEPFTYWVLVVTLGAFALQLIANQVESPVLRRLTGVYHTGMFLMYAAWLIRGLIGL